ncbi:TPM domain-containing protein [Tenacibaculum sp. M341]|uniref:TPM domain-containing protein n=1 Tax=Tenacibaculum sp. M341 TaxID=2530339 RepID=UPI001051FFB9|nr:TPM domain-containing protein [Tenacibaculum sp. M341]TCI94303.1 TPM domain-containing protein [Tenacibaculum sp. M341]
MKIFSFLISFLILFTSETSNAIQREDLQNNTSKRAPIFIAPSYEKLSTYTLEDVPNPKKYGANGFISDPDGIISNGDTFKLNKMLWQIENKTTVQVAIVALPSIGQEVPKDFAVSLFERWGIGQADKDNGLLILTVMDQRRTEFEVGYGLEHILTDLICHRIGTDEIVPYFKKGEFGKGFVAATEKIDLFVSNPDTIDDIYSQNISYEGAATYFLGLPFLIWSFFYVLLTGILIFRAYDKIKTIDQSKEEYYDKYNDLKAINDGWGCLIVFAAFLFPLYGILITILKNQKLRKYRYAPRYSRVNGKPLRLLNQSEEKHFLKRAEILEEELDAIEYDVWVTDNEDDVLILKYQGSDSSYSNCKQCGYKTYGWSHTRIIRSATYTSSGEKEEIHQCRNCNYSESIKVHIPKKVRQSSSSGSSSSSWSSGGSSGWSSGGSSSSSSSWGGGSSGGGGAGVSW